MIPIKDDAPRYSTPYVNYFIIVLNTLVFLFEVMLSRRSLVLFIDTFGFTPANVTSLLQGHPRVLPEAALLPIVTSMFLHAGWLHLIGNMWFLYIFGDNIEDYLGHFRYLLFYLLCGVFATCLQVVFTPNSTVAGVGASGAIAGVMGAYFLLFPSARVLTVVPIFFFFFFWIPAWVLLGYWFVIQFLSGAATSIMPQSQMQGGVAFWAHVGGFVAGISLIKLLPHRQRRFRYDSW